MTDLGTLGGNGSTVYNMNSYAEVVGQADVSGAAYHAFFYDTSMQDLGGLPGDSVSAAYGINNAAHVVGTSGPSGSSRAFLVSNGQMKDLNTITINASGWTLQVAYAINDNDQIVGWGTDPAGHVHAFLLNPLPLGAFQASGNLTVTDLIAIVFFPKLAS